MDFSTNENIKKIGNNMGFYSALLIFSSIFYFIFLRKITAYLYIFLATIIIFIISLIIKNLIKNEKNKAVF